MSVYNLLYFFYFIRFSYQPLDKFYARILTRVYNTLLPVYFKLSYYLPSHKINSDQKREVEYIVSLTTFPSRIDKVWLTIASILHQDVKPAKVILWLYEGEFKGKNSLPKKLLALERRGLEIRFCNENLMPHKKYYYTILENPDACIITIDDDMFYPPGLIASLLKCHLRYPEAICCAITREIKLGNGVIRPYNEWSYVRVNSEPRYSNLIMGGGGTLFPPTSLHPEVLNKELIIKYALKTDDLWLKVMSLKNNTKVLSLAGEFTRFFIPIISKNRNVRLMDTNIGEGQNNKVFEDLIRYYTINIDVFNK